MTFKLPVSLRIKLKLRAFYWWLRRYPEQYCGDRHPNGDCSVCSVRKLRDGLYDRKRSLLISGNETK
jgi:hypothetical protein